MRLRLSESIALKMAFARPPGEGLRIGGARAGSAPLGHFDPPAGRLRDRKEGVRGAHVGEAGGDQRRRRRRFLAAHIDMQGHGLQRRRHPAAAWNSCSK